LIENVSVVCVLANRFHRRHDTAFGFHFWVHLFSRVVVVCVSGLQLRKKEE
jgi:hypothetical protein